MNKSGHENIQTLTDSRPVIGTVAPAAVSVIVPAYNRASVLRRAVDSILGQDLRNLELIVVDNGSSDNTQEVLAGISDPRLVVVRVAVNRGVAPGYNAGLDQARGEWITTLSSHDELVPEALSTMLRVPTEIDSSIDAVTCNCLDTTTGQLSGLGLEHDQWLDFPTVSTKCQGEFWGVTKSSLLKNMRFNEKLWIPDGVFWCQINRVAKRYYVHKALRIYHTEGKDRVTRLRAWTGREAFARQFLQHYIAMGEQRDYLEVLRRFQPLVYAVTLRNVLLANIMTRRRAQANEAYAAGKEFWRRQERLCLRVVLMVGPALTRIAVQLALRCRSWRAF